MKPRIIYNDDSCTLRAVLQAADQTGLNDDNLADIFCRPWADRAVLSEWA